MKNKRPPLVIPRPLMGTGKTFTQVFIGKKGIGTTKQTPFLSIDKEVIIVGDMIQEVEKKRVDHMGLKKEMGLENKPMKVCFGQYKAGRDDWNVDFIVYGYYIEFHDGGVYSLTQDGGGYSIAAKNCKIVKK